MRPKSVIINPSYYFSSTIGDDIEICVTGDYSPPDSSVGYLGDFEITRVWLPSDPMKTDLQSCLSNVQLERLESEGYAYASEAESERKRNKYF